MCALTMRRRCCADKRLRAQLLCLVGMLFILFLYDPRTVREFRIIFSAVSIASLLPENRSYTSGVMPRKSTKTRPQQGMRLAELRKDAGLSQYELARCRLPQANIAFWER